MAETQFPTLRKLFRIAGWPVRHWRVFAVIAVVLVIVHTVADQLLLRKLAAQREAMCAEGVAVSFADFGFPRLSDYDNAAIAYRYIVEQIQHPRDDADGFEEVRGRLPRGNPRTDAEPAPLSDEEWSVVGEYVALNDDTYRMLREAQQLPGCQFGNYDSAIAIAAEPAALLPWLAHVRVLARHVAVKSAWEHHQGHTREAYESTIAGLHLANDLSSDPLLIVGLVRCACATIALESLQAMTYADELPDPLPDGLVAELEMLADRMSWIPFLQGEACFTNGEFMSASMQTGRFRRPIFWTPNQLAVNDLLLQLVRAAREEDYAKREAMLGTLREFRVTSPKSESPVSKEGMAKTGTAKRMMEKKGIEGVFGKKRMGPFFRFRVLAELLAPGLLRAQDAFERTHAQANGALLAIALKQYKRARGEYPDELVALVPEYVDELPQDPFNGEPFRYRREGDGFVLYSIGQNRKDDGGEMVEGTHHGDLVWCAVR